MWTKGKGEGREGKTLRIHPADPSFTALGQQVIDHFHSFLLRLKNASPLAIAAQVPAANGSQLVAVLAEVYEIEPMIFSTMREFNMTFHIDQPPKWERYNFTAWNFVLPNVWILPWELVKIQE